MVKNQPLCICNDYDGSNLGRGFQMTFKNGITVSVQWGSGNYCSGRDSKPEFEEYCGRKTYLTGKQSADAEIAIWVDDDKNTWVTRAVWDLMFQESLNDDVVGYLPPEQIAAVLNFCATATPMALVTLNARLKRRSWAGDEEKSQDEEIEELMEAQLIQDQIEDECQKGYR